MLMNIVALVIMRSIYLNIIKTIKILIQMVVIVLISPLKLCLKVAALKRIMFGIIVIKVLQVHGLMLKDLKII